MFTFKARIVLAHQSACAQPSSTESRSDPRRLAAQVIEFEAGKRAVGVKKVTANEEYFNGHFPNRPIMPGVLQVRPKYIYICTHI